MWNIRLNDQLLTVSDQRGHELLKLLMERVIEEYSKLASPAQMIAGTFCRNKLYEMEKNAFANGSSKEDAAVFRPDKGQDPVHKMLVVLMAGILEFTNGTEIRLGSDDNAEITHISVKLPDQSKAG